MGGPDANPSSGLNISLPTMPTNPPSGPRHASGSSTDATFDIVATYRNLLASDPDLTMPVAAIESLVHLLAATPNLSTTSETLDLLEANIGKLKRSTANSISLSAGTDLFTRYIVTALRPDAGGGGGGSSDFAAVRAHLLSSAKVIVSRAKEARAAIAGVARRFVRDGCTVLTTGGSRVVVATLREAALAQTRSGGAPRFRVVYATSDREASESAEAVASLRALSVPVAVVPESAVAYAMAKVDMAFVGAEGVVENGGVISRLGTYQVAALARPAGKPVYVLAESHKFVRMYPLNQFDIGFEQNILQFSTEMATPRGSGFGGDGGGDGGGDTNGMLAGVLAAAAAADGNTPRPAGSYFDKSASTAAMPGWQHELKKDAVDYTPPEYITAIVTEAGPRTPSAVSEELIKIWY